MRAVESTRSVLTEVLADFAARPFFNLREADPQAVILTELRKAISPPDVLLLPTRHYDGEERHRHPPELRTCRVHQELKLGDDIVDLAVFKPEGPIVLKVHENGPLDVLATVRGEDLAVVVEVKSAPSKNMWRDFARDIEKLGRITRANPECHGFFIAFDKSLSLGGATSRVRPDERWLSPLREDPEGRVEAVWLGDDGGVRRRRGFC
jgi:hypothetical protein